MFKQVIPEYEMTQVEYYRNLNDYIWVIYSNLGIIPLLVVFITKFFNH